jgi:hypothetical protein
VTYSPGFSFNSPFGPPPTAEIDPQTGRLHFNAPNIGVFVIAISVFEYRNGVLIAENKKDLQLRVLQCFPQNDPPLIDHVFSPQDSVVGDTVILYATDTTCYHVTLFDPDSSQLVIQPLSAIFTGPDAPTLTISGSNPMEIDICWDSRCEFSGTSLELILMGYDITNCPVYNAAFDTVYIKIIPPPEIRPEVNHLLPPQNPLGPDTLLVEVDSTMCFSMWVVDTVGGNGPQSHGPVFFPRWEQSGQSGPDGLRRGRLRKPRASLSPRCSWRIGGRMPAGQFFTGHFIYLCPSGAQSTPYCSA